MGTTVMDIFKQLPRTNCRECGLPTCLAFAAAAIQGGVQLDACPYVPAELSASVAGDVMERHHDEEQERLQRIAELKHQMAGVDLAAAAGRIGAVMNEGRLAIRCLGRVFELDAEGNLHSECHINPWVHGPILDHVLNGRGTAPTGEWVPFNGLSNTQDWLRFFEHKCVGGLSELVEKDPELFFDVMELFGARPNTGDDIIASADDAVEIHPLPRVPLLFCYWRADGELDSRFVIRFDRCAETNVDGGTLYRLCQGLNEMLRRIMSRHGHMPASHADAG